METDFEPSGTDPDLSQSSTISILSSQDEEKPWSQISTTSSASSVDSDGEETLCVICLEKLSEPASAQPCGHSSFDYLCLLTWLHEHPSRPSCPLCKSIIRTVRYDFAPDSTYKTYTTPIPAPTSTPSSSLESSASHPYRTNRRRVRFPPRPTYRELATLDDPVARRRHIYRNQLYSLHVGSNSLSGFREPTPSLFSSDAEAVSRARKWIRRELQVFEFLSSLDRRASNAEFLLEHVISILKVADIQESGGRAEDLLKEYLGIEDARLFLHELRNWLRSPYQTLAEWDRNVQYREVEGEERYERPPRLRRTSRMGAGFKLERMVSGGGTEGPWQLPVQQAQEESRSTISSRFDMSQYAYRAPGSGNYDR